LKSSFLSPIPTPISRRSFVSASTRPRNFRS